MKLILLIVFFLAPANIFAANIDNEVQSMLEIFDTYCLQNSNNFEHIEELVSIESKKTLIPPKTLMAISPNPDSRIKGYYIRRDKQRYMVSWIENQSCGVAGEIANVKKIKKLIKSSYPLHVKNIDKEGVQISELYSFDKTSNYEGGLLNLIYPKSNINSNIFVINYLPEREVSKILNRNK